MNGPQWLTDEAHDHLEFAWDLLESWIVNSDSAETASMLRLATAEFLPEQVMAGLLKIVAGTMSAVGEMYDETPIEHVITTRALVAAERSDP